MLSAPGITFASVRMDVACRKRSGAMVMTRAVTALTRRIAEEEEEKEKKDQENGRPPQQIDMSTQKARERERESCDVRALRQRKHSQICGTSLVQAELARRGIATLTMEIKSQRG